MEIPQRLRMLEEAAFNDQTQRIATALRFLDDEQLVEWATAIMRGETFICPLVDVPTLEKHLAATELLRESRRRREVAELEAE